MNTHQTTAKPQTGSSSKQLLLFFMLICLIPVFSFGQWAPVGAGSPDPIYREGSVGIGTTQSNPTGSGLFLKNTIAGAGWNVNNFSHLHSGTYGVYGNDNIWSIYGMHRQNPLGTWGDYGAAFAYDKYGATFGLKTRSATSTVRDAYITWSYNEADPTAPNNLQFQFNNLTLGTSLDAVTFTPTGRVGIGHKDPWQKLLVYSEDVPPFAAWQHDNIPFNYCSIFQVENDLTKAIVVNKNGVDETFVVTGNGVINPWRKTVVGDQLQVEERVSINASPNGFRLFVNGNAFTTGAWQGSDKNLKYNIVTLPTILDKVMLLNPVNYLFKQDIMINNGDKKVHFNLPEGNQFGFIAQDLEEIFPEMVNSDAEYKAVNYSMLIPVLTQAIKEQQAIIEKQNQEIAKLNDKVDCLSPCQKEAPKTEVGSGASLEQNVPNPFGKNTVIKYHLPANSVGAMLIINDLNGRQLKRFNLTAQEGNVEISGKDFVPGTYLYTLIANEKELDSKKMIIVGE